MIGQTLAHYKVLEKLGSGGMGEVYVAEDTKLSRKVALKVLPPEMASPERLMRFEREAKAVAALDHPNIVTIYSVEEAEGVHFITMQLVRGKTLTELISKKALPLNKLFEIAIPLADAVSAAHEQGIIHRDLKPDNLMVTDDGRLMILDFGLAKLKQEFAEEGLSELPTQSPTQEGRILGTVAYMSPEQAEGKHIDHRSDIFSIGIILYEMATGQRPFQGDTTASMLSSILRDTPTSATELNPELPRDLGKIIRRCLSKDTTRRFQTALDVRNELEELKAEVDSGEVFEGAPTPQRSRSKPWLFAAVMVVLVLALAGTLAYFLRLPVENVIRLTNPVQVTTHLARESRPSWSPDGQTVAYESNQDGDWDIWVKQIGSTEAVNRTEDHSGYDGRPSWSPDGRQIAFASMRDGVLGLFVMPALAGAPRRVASPQSGSNYNSTPQWSSDGTELAVLTRRSTTGQIVEIVSLGSYESRVLVVEGNLAQYHELSWSPDGRYFAYLGMGSDLTSPVTQVWITSVADEESFPVTDGRTNERSPSWSSDGRALFFVSNRGGSMDLWMQSIGSDGRPSGEPRALTTGIGMQRAAYFSPDGRKLIYEKGGRYNNIWRVPILSSRLATWTDAQPLTSEQATIENIHVSPDGRWLFFNSDRFGNQDLWKMPSGGGEIQQVTTNPSPDWRPQLSPDGKRIAFMSHRSGNRDIWVMPEEGGAARQLTNHEATDGFHGWSPDGQMLAFLSGRDGGGQLWVIPAEGGEARQLTHHPESDSWDSHPEWSHDGKWVFFYSGRNDGIWRVPAEGGEEEPVTNGPGGFPLQSLDGKRIFYRRLRSGNIWAVSLDDGTEYPLTDLEGRPGGGAYLAIDSEYLYFTWGRRVSDLWVMDVVQE